jgi:hypothetical protein
MNKMNNRTSRTEAVFNQDKHVLIYGNPSESTNLDDFNYIVNNFCGRVYHVSCLPDSIRNTKFDGKIWAMGDLKDMPKGQPLQVIGDHSTFENWSDMWTKTDDGQVPINVDGIGVFFRRSTNLSLFKSLLSGHKMFTLTETNKAGTAHRTGTYLSPMTCHDGSIEYKYLRCSTNLDGPTQEFNEFDNQIVVQVNGLMNDYFTGAELMNHVLMQLYNNTVVDGKQVKARISSHADKTKDMPEGGVMAFVTLYDLDELAKLGSLPGMVTSRFDMKMNGKSIFPTLLFKPKADIPHLKEQSIPLYPGSVFIMSLSSNRIYTHAVVPAVGEVAHLPTRLGYVARCSNRTAKWQEDGTYVKYDDTWHQMLPTDSEEASEEASVVRNLYFQENTTMNCIEYGQWYSSFNKGDYMKPMMN